MDTQKLIIYAILIVAFNVVVIVGHIPMNLLLQLTLVFFLGDVISDRIDENKRLENGNAFHCYRCQKVNNEYNRFCFNCGTQLKEQVGNEWKRIDIKSLEKKKKQAKPTDKKVSELKLKKETNNKPTAKEQPHEEKEKVIENQSSLLRIDEPQIAADKQSTVLKETEQNVKDLEVSHQEYLMTFSESSLEKRITKTPDTVFESKDVKYCKKCGTMLREGALYCHKCGAKVI